MAFFLFILVNAALFIRPGEIVPALLGWEIYFYVILTCLVFSVPDLLKYMTGQAPQSQPVTLCVLGMAAIIPLPFLFASDMAEAWRTEFLYAKIVAYYLLFVSLITTVDRLRTLVLCVLIFSGLVTLLAVLRYHDAIQLETIEALKESVSDRHGDTVTIKRLQGTGIFQDPNELCVLLSAMLPLSLYFLLTDRNILLRAACLPLVPLFAYAVYLTQSRGGFIAFAGGLGVLTWMRFGWKKAALIGAVGAPLLLLLFAGRQTEISTQAGTAQTRIELWRDWLQTFKENMLLGKGMPLQKEEDVKNRRPDEGKRHLAHNSYLQGFADMGLVGGTLLVGAFFTAGWSLLRCHPSRCLYVNVEAKTMHPYITASVAAYALGMATLSICFIVPTYMILALAVAYAHIARRSFLAGPAPLTLDVPLLARFAAVGFCTLAGIYAFVRVLA